MLKLCTHNKEKVLDRINNGYLDAVVPSSSNLVDDIILKMCDLEVVDLFDNSFDKRAHNAVVPFNLILMLSVAAKMKIRTSLTDIPYAIQDHRTLSRLGYNAVTKGTNELLTEGTIRALLNKYDTKDLFKYYNKMLGSKIMPKMNLEPNIHILDCTKIKVNLDNENYEGATIGTDKDGNAARGYKLSTLRGLTRDTGIIEEVRFGTISEHDLELSKEMLMNTKCLRSGDILINDRGFLSRELVNFLKVERQVDSYVPLRKNMDAHDLSIAIANQENDWQPHPTRKEQMYHFVKGIERYWGNSSEQEVELNACVIWHGEESQTYGVVVTTDLNATGRDIIMTYQLRPEIEEDYRQLKDFWKMEDFKSTKLNVISYHVVCVLFGYLFYQLYLLTDEGEELVGKSLPVLLKKYKTEALNHFVLYSDDSFCTLPLTEFMEFYRCCSEGVRNLLSHALDEIK